MDSENKEVRWSKFKNDFALHFETFCTQWGLLNILCYLNFTE